MVDGAAASTISAADVVRGEEGEGFACDVEGGDVVGSGLPEKRLQAIVAARMGRPPVMGHERWPERRRAFMPFLKEKCIHPSPRTLRVRSSPRKSLSESSLTSHAACAITPSFDVIPRTARDRLIGLALLIPLLAFRL